MIRFEGPVAGLEFFHHFFQDLIGLDKINAGLAALDPDDLGIEIVPAVERLENNRHANQITFLQAHVSVGPLKASARDTEISDVGNKVSTATVYFN